MRWIVMRSTVANDGRLDAILTDMAMVSEGTSSKGCRLIQAYQACASTSRTSMSSIVTTSGANDGTRSLIASAASSDSKMTIANPESSFRVQYPVTNPGACDTTGTTRSRRSLREASMSSSVTLTTTACTGALLCRWLARVTLSA